MLERTCVPDTMESGRDDAEAARKHLDADLLPTLCCGAGRVVDHECSTWSTVCAPCRAFFAFTGQCWMDLGPGLWEKCLARCGGAVET